MTYKDIKYFLEKKGWEKSNPREGVTRYTSPGWMKVDPPVYFDLPESDDAADLERYVPRILETLSALYNLSITEIGHLVNPPINCNTQIYTIRHVPPFLFKAVLPMPYFFFFHTIYFRYIFKYWYRWKTFTRYRLFYTKTMKWFYHVKLWLHRYGRPFKPLINFMTLVQLYFLFLSPLGKDLFIVTKLETPLRPLYIIPDNMVAKVLLISFMIIYYDDVRNFVVLVFKKIIAFLKSFQGRRFRRVSDFVYNTGSFSFANNSKYLLNILLRQYPEGAGFVIHTIDLDYMGAGRPGINFKDQIGELLVLIKKSELNVRIFPFLFIDPRRIKQDPDFFLASISDHKVFLQTCFVKNFIETEMGRLGGFKLNPALGYYPFDEALLPVWKYAADNKIPLYVNCNRDALYYRGKKQRDWDFHPVFKESVPSGSPYDTPENWHHYQPLFLPQVENDEFTMNFMHPLNYLCLLYEPLLRKIVSRYSSRTKELFGFINDDTPMLHNLTHSRLCFSHYGGVEEWERFMKYDDGQNEVLRKPNEGINFFTRDGKLSLHKLAILWKDADWYSLISTLMLQYPDVYADISHIPNNPQIYSLFKRTMQNAKLKSKVILGTGFYMVHRRKSERTIITEIGEYLSSDEMTRVFETNPRHFLGVL